MSLFIGLGVFFALIIVEFLIIGAIFRFTYDTSEDAIIISLATIVLALNLVISLFVTDFYRHPTAYGYQKIKTEQTVEKEIE